MKKHDKQCARSNDSPLSPSCSARKSAIFISLDGDSLPDLLTVKAYPPRRGKT